MKKVFYSSPFVPPEWIAAHGLVPSRPDVDLTCCAGPVGLGAGICPYMRGFVNGVCASKKAAVCLVLATSCDQMRRAMDLVEMQNGLYCLTSAGGVTALESAVPAVHRHAPSASERPSIGLPVFLMHVPATWKTAGVRRLYKSELARLGRFLECSGGAKPNHDTLVDVMLEYDERRKNLRLARSRLNARRLEGAGRLRMPAGKIPVALCGGPLSKQALPVLDIIGECGGTVVLDGTETGERALPRAFVRGRLSRDPLGELADAYAGSIPDAFRRPNTRLYAWAGREIRRSGARALLVARYLWCDIWHAEVQRLRQRLPVPVLDLDFGGEGDLPRARMKIQTLLASLRPAGGGRGR